MGLRAPFEASQKGLKARYGKIERAIVKYVEASQKGLKEELRQQAQNGQGREASQKGLKALSSRLPPHCFLYEASQKGLKGEITNIWYITGSPLKHPKRDWKLAL